MTTSTNKPKRHPTFTLGELKAIRSALTSAAPLEPYASKDAQEALEKVANAIAYREDARPKRFALPPLVSQGDVIAALQQDDNA